MRRSSLGSAQGGDFGGGGGGGGGGGVRPSHTGSPGIAVGSPRVGAGTGVGAGVGTGIVTGAVGGGGAGTGAGGGASARAGAGAGVGASRKRASPKVPVESASQTVTPTEILPARGYSVRSMEFGVNASGFSQRDTAQQIEIPPVPPVVSESNVVIAAASPFAGDKPAPVSSDNREVGGNDIKPTLREDCSVDMRLGESASAVASAMLLQPPARTDMEPAPPSPLDMTDAGVNTQALRPQ